MCTQNKLFCQSSQIFKDNVFLKGLCSLLNASWQNMVIWLTITFPSCLAFCAFFLALHLSLVYVDISRRLIARVRVFWFLLVQGKMPLLNEVCLLDYHVLLFLVYPVNILSYFAIIMNSFLDQRFRLIKDGHLPSERGKETCDFQRICMGFVAPRDQRLGERQRCTTWWARHSEDTANDHLVQTCLY